MQNYNKILQHASGEYPTYQINSRDYSWLLGKVLDVLSISLPNKQQHSAAEHIVRKAFDDTYFSMLRLTYPDSEFGPPGDGYAVEAMR